MTTHAKLRTANVLMLIGILPLALGVAWVAAVIASAHRFKGQMGGSDAFLMIAVLLMSYLFALLVAGAGALWSISITKRDAGLRSTPAVILRAVVALALGAPLLWYVGIQFRLF